MREASCRIDVKVPCDLAFDAVHDYGRRLIWDVMLSAARMLDGARTPAVGVRTLCVGTWRSAYLPMETVYITFRRGATAAVRLTNAPPLFERFAASIRHAARPGGGSRIIYTYSFRKRPRWCARLVEPVVARLVECEIRARPVALRDFLNRGLESPS